MAISSFKSKEIQLFFESGKPPRKAGWSLLEKVVKRKLDMLNYAKEIKDLLSPPSNNFEALKGKWKGYYSIRINRQWRIVFRWDRSPKDVDIVDYH